MTFFEDGTAGSGAARREYNVQRGTFAAILVGKDGGEKFRSGEPVRPEILFDLIDAMPMRQREMQNKEPR